MTSRLDQAIAQIRTLPEDDQDRAAAALLAFADERSSDTCFLTDEELAGIDHAVAQADRGVFASSARVRGILGGAA